MQVNSVSSAQSFKALPLQAQIFASLDDNQLKGLAYQKAKIDVDDKKHRRLTNLLYYSVPLAAGAAAAVNPTNMSRIGRLGAGLRGVAALAIPFAIVDAVFAGKHAVDKNSRTSAQFTTDHPILASLATLAVGIAGIVAFNKGAVKFGAKYGEQIANRIAPTVANIAEKLDKSEVLNFTSRQLAKLPSALKEIGKTALDWAPWMLIFANVGHTINHDNVKNAQYIKNYEALKNVQSAIRGIDA